MAKYPKMNKVDGLIVIPFGPLILKTVSPLDPHSPIVRRNPGLHSLTSAVTHWPHSLTCLNPGHPEPNLFQGSIPSRRPILRSSQPGVALLSVRPHLQISFVYAPSQWEMLLQCNIVSYWLSRCTEWSLHLSNLQTLPTFGLESKTISMG